MYSWGGDTKNWKKPGGYKFDSARKPYLDALAADASKKGPRSYTGSVTAPNFDLVDAKKVIRSESENPIVIGVDVTGSMARWPLEIFDRLPLLDQTLSQYREGLEFCFAAIGDAYCDNYPLQVNDFANGLELEDKVNALCPEGNGGGQVSETYELFGYYMLNKCEMPNATSPFMFIFGDEKFYNMINPDQVEHYIGDKLQSELESEAMWKGLMQKFNLFYLHKPYGDGFDSGVDKEIVDSWGRVIGPQRVIELPNQERAVDVAMGIIAKYWGKFGDFGDSMGARQDTSTIASVKASIRHLPNDPCLPITRNSRLLKSGFGSASKRLD